MCHFYRPLHKACTDKIDILFINALEVLECIDVIYLNWGLLVWRQLV